MPMPTPTSDVSAQVVTDASFSDASAIASHSANHSLPNLPTEVELGARLKTLREAHGLSQRELAKRAGITNSNISMIEQGQVSPSVQSLVRILGAFPMSLADFFSCDLSLLDACIYRASDVANSVRDDESGVLVRRLVRANSHPQLDMQVHVLPGGFSGRLARNVSSQDWTGVIQQGNLQLWIGAKCYDLSVNDGFCIPRGIDCRVINPSSEPVSLVSCSLFIRND